MLADAIACDRVNPQSAEQAALHDALCSIRARGSQVALAYQAKERELLVKEAAIYRIFVYDGQAREHGPRMLPHCDQYQGRILQPVQPTVTLLPLCDLLRVIVRAQ
jgi:hypothetical protein